MPQPSAVREFELHDTENLLRAVNRHWDTLLANGATEELRTFLKTALEEAKDSERPRDPRRIALDAARLRLADLLGDYRVSADLVASPIDGPIPRRGQGVGPGGRFPWTDAKLKEYIARIAPAVRHYKKELKRRAFGPEAQAALAAAGEEFVRALQAMPRLRGEAYRQAKAREAQLARLRRACALFRRIAYMAFEGSPDQVDFDRVRLRPNPFHLVSNG